MIDLLKNFLSPFVVAYILGVIAIPFITPVVNRVLAARKVRRRRAAGLDDVVLSNPGDGLQKLRFESIIETLMALAVVITLPILLIWLVENTGLVDVAQRSKEIEKINVAFVAFTLWTLVSGTTIARSFLGGLAFRSLAAFSDAIQVGDRVTIKGHHGVVKGIGVFYTQLQTLSDDLISIPSNQLLDEVLSSTNAGARASRCSIPFYLSPANPSAQIQRAEDLIWATIQGSIYYDFAHPLKIQVSQERRAILLTAHCYVTTTYEEAEFASGVTRRVLAGFAENGIALSGVAPSKSDESDKVDPSSL